MALTERLQILIESLGGRAVVGDFEKIGKSGEANFGKVSKAGNKAAADLKAAQDRMAAVAGQGQAKLAAATQRVETAQLKAAHAAGAVERAQVKVGAAAPGSLAAAAAAEKLELAQLKAGHAGQAVERAQAQAALATTRAAHAHRAATADVAKAERAVAKLGTTTNTTSGLLGRLGSTGNVAHGSLTQLGLAGGSVGKILAGSVPVAAAATGVAIAGLAARGVGDFQRLTAEVRKLKAVTGESAEGASQLRNIGAALGVDTETVANAFFKLSRVSQTNVEDLRSLGVQVVRTKDGTIDLNATLLALADGYRANGDAASRNRILFDAFGRSGATLRPILSATRGELERLAESGPVFDQDDLDTGRKLAIATRELRLEGQKFSVEVAKGITPGLSALARLGSNVLGVFNSITAAPEDSGRLTFFDGLRKTVHAATNPVDSLFASIDQLKGKNTSLVPTVEDVVAGLRAQEQAADVLSQAMGVLDEETGGLASSAADLAKLKASSGSLSDELDRLILGAVGSDRATAGFNEALAQLQSGLGGGDIPGLLDKLTSAQERYGDAQKDAAKAAEEAAERQLAADRKVRDAQETLADAQAAVGKAKSRQERDEAQRKVRDAQEGLGDARKGQTDTTEENEDRRVELQRRLRDALKEQTGAQKELDDAQAAARLSLDLTTEKGRENNDLILTAVERLQGHANELISHRATQDQVRTAWDADVEALRRVLSQAGFTGAEVDTLIGKYNLIPPVRETYVRLAGQNEAIAEAERVAREIAEKLRFVGGSQNVPYPVSTGGGDDRSLAQQLGDFIGNTLNLDNFPSLPGRARGGLVPIALAAKGLKVNTPTAIAGEGNPNYPEYVLATDPAHRGPNQRMWMSAGRDLKMLAAGGMSSYSGSYAWAGARAGSSSIDYERLGAVIARHAKVENHFQIVPPPGVSPLHIAKAIVWDMP